MLLLKIKDRLFSRALADFSIPDPPRRKFVATDIGVFFWSLLNQQEALIAVALGFRR